MTQRRTLLDCFPNRDEQAVVMIVLTSGAAVILVVMFLVGSRNKPAADQQVPTVGWRDIDDDSAIRAVRFIVNINTAAWPEIAQLPRIGPVMAQRIIAYRHAHGPFQTPTQLMLVRGIGEKMFAAMAPHITLQDARPQESSPGSLASCP